MDVDPIPLTPSSSTHFFECPLPRIDENNTFDSKTPKERVIEMLDVLESHVEKLRKGASQLEEDRDQLLSSIDSVRNTDIISELAESDRDDINRYADRILSRCLTVEVKILTQRDNLQEEALHQVNHLIDGLIMYVKTDADFAKAKCLSYMNACSSHVEEGVTDKNFESALLGCTVDDQKRVKKRLQGLLNYFDKLNNVTMIP
ncbi:BAG family molecular chaperone regulator 2 [Harmonia axyridis]|uniref:BAG family molecular chaperone regulator 2 n=1 Tax=Harmonia axyridis TaxID=115357 RepID=UPI001E279743|nr:BAG family molecular chaperone regulator 2 [Harmonia axyridis]